MKPFEAAGAADSRRIVSLDILRGAVMVLMALDHVRVYSAIPAGGPTPGIFFTRWITHFCAPAFVFLAGTGAFLHGEKLASRGALSKFLLTRGAWLLLLELTVIRLSWTFNFDFESYLLAGVIWAIGWSMIVLAALVHLPPAWTAAIGALMVAGHNLLDGRVQELSKGLEGNSLAWLWRLLYFGGEVRIGPNGPPLVVLYSLVPWIGVVALGFAFGVILRLNPERRRQACLAIGLGAMVAFFVLRGANLYGDPRPWGRSGMPALFAFLNTTKYPASLLFLLMTLGPMIALIPLLAHARGRVAGFLTVFGRVPLFYYLLHISLIHMLAVIVSVVREGAVNPWLFANHPMRAPAAPDGYTWSLPLLYWITAAAVALLYFPCRRFADVKRRSRAAWLSYL